MVTETKIHSSIEPYLTELGVWEDGILTYPIPNPSPAGK